LEQQLARNPWFLVVFQGEVCNLLMRGLRLSRGQFGEGAQLPETGRTGGKSELIIVAADGDQVRPGARQFSSPEGSYSLLKPYRLESALALIMLSAVVVMDLSIPRLVQRIIDEGIAARDQEVVVRTTLLMLGLAVLSTLFAIGNSLLSVRVGEAFARDVRRALFAKVQSFSFGNLDRLRTGPLITRLTSDISQVQMIVRMALRIGTRAPLLIIGSLILLVATSARLALWVLPVLALLVGVLVFFISRLQPLFLRVQVKLDRLNTLLQENLAGVRVVKAFAREAYERSRFGAVNREFSQDTAAVMEFVAFLFPSLMFIVNLGVVVVVGAGGYQAIQGELTAGEIIAFINYLLTSLSPLMIFARISGLVASSEASAGRILEVLESEPEVRDFPGAVPVTGRKQGEVCFEGVYFAYNGRSQAPALQEISFQAAPGERVAVLGSTGAGKSTLVGLIPRFYDVTAGSVKIDGRDVRDYRQEALRADIAVVLQETVLFSGTVAENLRYGRPDASQEEIERAARAAQAHEFILALPQGYDTYVEQRGRNLSGGQVQRLGIARALVTQPRILILDDSTSAVDFDTEARIQAALAEMLGDCTLFIVAQRISTVMGADKILLLERGRLAAIGTHRELLARSPIYQEIYSTQLGDVEAADV